MINNYNPINFILTNKFNGKTILPSNTSHLFFFIKDKDNIISYQSVMQGVYPYGKKNWRGGVFFLNFNLIIIIIIIIIIMCRVFLGLAWLTRLRSRQHVRSKWSTPTLLLRQNIQGGTHHFADGPHE